MREQNQLAQSLLEIAKEFKNLQRIREFKQEFENDIKRSQSKLEISDTEQSTKPTADVKKEEPLEMNVYEDKDYDIDEVKILNFISKCKATKPSIVRTLVYKTPESSYVVRKSIVMSREAPESNLNAENTSSSINVPSSTETSKEVVCESAENDKKVKKNEMHNEKMPQKEENNSLKKDSTSHLPEVTKSKPFASIVKTQVNVESAQKFHSDDVIMIDEDDDIIEHDESNYEEIGDQATRLPQHPENNNNNNTKKSNIHPRRHKKQRTKSTS